MQVVGLNKAQRLAARAAQKMKLDSKLARPHELLLFAKFSADNNELVFQVEDKLQRAIVPQAEGLQDRDAYVAIAMGMGLMKVPLINDIEYPEAGIITYFPDPNVFSVAAGAATLSQAQALESYYHGRHTIQTNEGIRINKQPNRRFRTVQQTQGSATTTNMLTGIEMKEIGAAVRLAGGDNNTITVNMNCKDKTHFVGSADHVVYGVIVLSGSIIKGGTNKKFLG